ncbi:response regulator [Thermoproteota archaeon]
MSNKTILLIDDEKDLVDMMTFQLKAKGYEVQIAYNGLEGLEKLKNLKPVLIILDINMPKMSGLEFYNKITSGGRSKFPVLVLTARANLEQTFKDIAVDGFMAKPFEIDAFLKEVDRIISEKIVSAKTSMQTVFLLDFRENPHANDIKSTLEKEKYSVVLIEGINNFESKAKQAKPDYILMEYMQKGRSGEDCIRDIRNDLASIAENFESYKAKIPIIVYTYSGFDYKEKSLSAGADLYIGKPGSYTDFVDAIKRF